MSLIYSPGPAAYDIGSGIGKAPSTTLKGRYKDRAATDNPGPGAYNLANTVGQGLQYTLRPKTNLPADGSNTPGPGSYTPSSSTGPRISMAPKLNLAGLSDSPGPGAYSSPFEVGKEAPKYSMTSRSKVVSDDSRSVPGPGTYNLDGHQKPRLAASMKSRHYDKPDDFQPGPGAYKLADTVGGTANGVSYTMRPKNSPKSSSEAVPGPGTYSLATTIGTAPSMSMTSRRSAAKGDSVPGPGTYRLEGHTGREGLKYTLRPKTNLPADGASAPGPGAYNPDPVNGKGPKISMSPKLQRTSVDGVPGPGNYNPQTSSGSPSYSMPGRGSGKSANEAVPGPGTYQTPDGLQKPRHAITMKSRHYDKPDAFQPGPGAYNHETGQTIGSNAPKVSMHKKLGDYTYASSTNPPFLPEREY